MRPTRGRFSTNFASAGRRSRLGVAQTSPTRARWLGFKARPHRATLGPGNRASVLSSSAWRSVGSWVAVGGAVDLDDVGVVAESVDGRAGEQGVAEDGGPLRGGAVGGDDGGAALVAESDELVEVGGLVCAQGHEAEVVDDEEIEVGEGGELSLVAAVSAGGAELGEEAGRGDEEDLVAPSHGAVAEGLGEMGLSDARGADEEDVLVAIDEVAGGEIDDLGLWDVGVEQPVENLQGALALETRSGDALLELLAVSPLDLIAEEAQEKLPVVEVDIDGLVSPPRDRPPSAPRRRVSARPQAPAVAMALGVSSEMRWMGQDGRRWSSSVRVGSGSRR